MSAPAGVPATSALVGCKTLWATVLARSVEAVRLGSGQARASAALAPGTESAITELANSRLAGLSFATRDIGVTCKGEAVRVGIIACSSSRGGGVQSTTVPWAVHALTLPMFPLALLPADGIVPLSTGAAACSRLMTLLLCATSLVAVRSVAKIRHDARKLLYS